MKQAKILEVCFRNDDVNVFSKELVELTDIFLSRQIPITHAVEPGNLTKETINWLKEIKRNYPDLIEIVQHGWRHSIHGKGEFGAGRSYEWQFSDLERGKQLLADIFGNDFFPMITIPFGIYNKDTIRAADSLAYKVFTSHYDYRLSRRLFYVLGHALRRGQLFGRHISNHLNYYPGTRLFEVDSSISFAKRYFSPFGNECEMFSSQELIRTFDQYEQLIPVIIFLIHHRYHHKKHDMQLVNVVLDELQKRVNITFVNYANIYGEYSRPNDV